MKTRLVEVWREFAVASAVYLLLTALLVGLCIARNHGVFVYPLDDTYIHMAIAKNVALHGVWGISQNEFANASSSPAYTALLSATYWLLGVHTSLPLLLNVFFGLMLILGFALFVAKWWTESRWQWRLAAAIAMILLLPLPVLTVIAMEHVLHAAVILLLAESFFDAVSWFRLPLSQLHCVPLLARDGSASAGRSLSGVETNPDEHAAWRLAILAATSMLIRYETGFVLLPMLIVLALRRKWVAALAVAISATVAVVAVGLIFVHYGGTLLPNSVLIKSSAIIDRLSQGDILGAVSFAFVNAFRKLTREPLLALCCVVMGLLVIGRRSSVANNHPSNSNHPSRYPTWRDTEAPAAFAICASAFALHLLSTVPVWFFRYQSYLAALCCAGLVVALSNGLGSGFRRKLVTAMLALLVIGSVARMWYAFEKVPQASQNIHDQQYQMARFLRDYYTGQAVAVNDIGAVGYFVDVETVDLYGLGNNRIAKLRRSGKFGATEIESVCKSYRVGTAILYDKWFPNMPKSWQRVCRWTIPNNYICGGDTVSFYATTPSSAPDLRRNLTSFARKLPKDVVVSWD